MNRLESFEKWGYRRVLKIPWLNHVTNTEVLDRLNKESEAWKGKYQEYEILISGQA